MISVILAGGSGVRFWPLSREQYPKQLLKIVGDRTLIQQTVERLLPLTPIDRIYVVTNEQHAVNTLQQLERYGFDPAHLLAEPCGRNTAPAIAWAARLLADSPDEVMAVYPADHVVTHPEAFQQTIKQAESVAQTGSLVTLGVQPTRPETGFGYIKSGDALKDGAHQVERFVEKPDRPTAEKFIQEGGYTWNCGIFLWQVSAIQQELQTHLPDVYDPMTGIIQHMTSVDGKSPYQRLNAQGKNLFESLPSISIDYGVMEKSNHVAVVPTTMDWNDVGCWTALDDLSEKDAQGNVAAKDVYLVDCTGTLVKSDQRLIGAVGVDNLIIVDTDDALLVCHKDRAQDVKQLVERIKQDKHPQTKIHSTVKKPWGSYTVLDKKNGYLLKRLEVLPGESLSLQSHQHRSEHWVVAAGVAEVQCDDKTFTLERDQSTNIPLGARHRLSNPGDDPLVIIETQLGEILDESDITRYEDRYGRIDPK